MSFIAPLKCYKIKEEKKKRNSQVHVDVGLMVATLLHKNKYLSPEHKQNINNEIKQNIFKIELSECVCVCV